MHARPPRVREEAHAAVGGAQRGGGVGWREEERGAARALVLLEVLPARELGECAGAQGVGVVGGGLRVVAAAPRGGRRLR